MPNSVFDLGGELSIDTSQVKTLKEQVSEELDKVGQLETKAAVTVDDGKAKAQLKEVSTQVKDLGREIEKKHTLNIDTAKASSDAKSFGRTLADEMFGPSRESLADLEAKIGGMQGGGGIGRFLSGRGGMAVGGGMVAGGLAGAFAIGSSAVKSAYAVDLMEKSTEQVFGAAAESYKAEAEKMADATGFLTQQLLAAQIAMNKTVQLNSGEVTRNGRTMRVGLTEAQVQPLVSRAADLADTSGLPQYANNLEAVTSAIASGLRGTTTALLDFGIRLDDLYVLSLPVNAQFKALGESITPAEMAVARYNAIMEQTSAIAGKASENQDDINASMREFNQKMEGAKEAVGEALIPVANALADFISFIPKELLQAGVWAGLGLSLATALGGAVIGIRALITAARDLGRAATTSAGEVAAGSATATGDKGLGGVVGTLGAVAVAAPIAIDALSELVNGITNEEDYHENRYTDMINSIQTDDGSPGWFDKLAGVAAKIPMMYGNFIGMAAIVAGASGPTQTETNAAWNTKGKNASLDAMFQSWLVDNPGVWSGKETRAGMEAFRTQGDFSGGDYVSLPGTSPWTMQKMTYDQLKGWWQGQYTDSVRDSGAEVPVVKVDVGITNRSNADLQLDAGAYERTVR